MDVLDYTKLRAEYLKKKKEQKKTEEDQEEKVISEREREQIERKQLFWEYLLKKGA